MISLTTGSSKLTVARQGAEIKDWSVNGKPLLWCPDPAVWNETAPLLFPVVGWTKDHQVRVGGKIYPLGLHGFARHLPFEVVGQDESWVRLVLVSDAETRTLYPFDFRLAVDYRLAEDTLTATLEVENSGADDMPYACGIHPGFRWPFAGGAADDYLVRFAIPENPILPRIAAGGLIAESTRRLPLEGRVLHLRPQLFDNDALCFLYAKSRMVRFEAPNGAAISVEMDDFQHIGIWCRPGHGYLCIEEWTGFSDLENFEGDLFSKPSMIVLPPGAQRRHEARYTYADAPRAP